MPRFSKSYTLYDWEKLLKAVQENEAELAGIEPFRSALARAYAQAMTFRDVRDSLVAAAADAAQRLNEAVATGYDAALSLRSFIRSVYGPQAEKLIEYGIRPRGSLKS